MMNTSRIGCSIVGPAKRHRLPPLPAVSEHHEPAVRPSHKPDRT